MSSKIKVLQVIPKLGYGGAETGCYDLAHYLAENNCKSYIVTSGGDLLKFIDKKKVKLFFFTIFLINNFVSFVHLLILPLVKFPEDLPCPEYSKPKKPSFLFLQNF